MLNSNDNFQSWLRSELNLRVQRNPRYSLRAFAATLKMAPGALSEMLSGKRVPSRRIARKLIDNFDLDPAVATELWNSLENSRRNKRLARMGIAPTQIVAAAEAPRESTDNRPSRELPLEQFHVMADWYHYAILELTHTRRLEVNHRSIAVLLGITPAESKLAVERLLAMGLLRKETRGAKCFLTKVDRYVMTNDRHLSTPALRKRARQILEKASDALDSVPVSYRDASAMTFAVNPYRIKDAKKLIQQFLLDLQKFLQKGQASHVYEIAVHLFPLQKLGELNE